MVNEANIASTHTHTKVNFWLNGIESFVEIPNTPDHQICLSHFKSYFPNHSWYTYSCKVKTADGKERRKLLINDSASLWIDENNEATLYLAPILIGVDGFRGFGNDLKRALDQYDLKWKTQFENSVQVVLDLEKKLKKFGNLHHLHSRDEMPEEEEYIELLKTYRESCSIVYNNVESDDDTQRLVRLGIINRYQKLLIDSVVLVKGARDDGLPAEAYRTDRHRTVYELFADLSTNTKLQLSSPPGSGKSSLAALLMRYVILIHKRNAIYIPCSSLGEVTKTDQDADNFIRYIASSLSYHYKLLFDNLSEEPTIDQIAGGLKQLMSEEDTVVITDSSHQIFMATGFWNYVIKDSRCRLLCLSTLQLDGLEQRSLETLRFDRFEFDELLDTTLADRTSAWFTPRVRDEIFVHSEGFPCLVFRFIRHVICNHEDLIYEQYFGLNLYRFFRTLESLATVRCFPSSEHIMKYLLDRFKNTNVDIARLLKLCLHKLILIDSLTPSFLYSHDSSFSQSDYDLCLKSLVNICVCGWKKRSNGEEEYFLWSSTFRHVYTQEYLRLLRSPKKLSTEIANNICSSDPSQNALFLKKVVSLFSSGLLRESVTYDRFLFLGLSLLGFTPISAKGTIDYYNSDYDVLIKVIQNGERFLDGGEYSDISNYLVIDFNELENDSKSMFNRVDQVLTEDERNAKYKYKYFSVHFSPSFKDGKIYYWSNSDRLEQIDFNCLP